jgi:hypothetical protein
LAGVIDEKSFGDGERHSILARIISDYGNDRGRQFLDDAVYMLIWVIIINGLTMAIDEVDIGATRQEILNIIGEAENQSAIFIKAFFEEDEETLPCDPGRTLEETLENKLMGLANDARKRASDLAAGHLGDNAHSVIMTKSGARGNALNLGQMAACVGQQSVRQKRIHRGYTERTLPHFKLKDLSLKARGFVTSSYRHGLSPIEFFFHAMGGREGLVDTAVRTSSSGYMQRRLVNALQDMVVENDLSVRTSDRNIIQFKYGDDKIDPGRSDNGVPADLDLNAIKTKALKEMLNIEKEISNRTKDEIEGYGATSEELLQEDYENYYSTVDDTPEIKDLKRYEKQMYNLMENRIIEMYQVDNMEDLKDLDYDENDEIEEYKPKVSSSKADSKKQDKAPVKASKGKAKKEVEIPSEDELKDIFLEENPGKNVIWKGKTTDTYKNWKKDYIKNLKGEE